MGRWLVLILMVAVLGCGGERDHGMFKDKQERPRAPEKK